MKMVACLELLLDKDFISKAKPCNQLGSQAQLGNQKKEQKQSVSGFTHRFSHQRFPLSGQKPHQHPAVA
jgi:hypothetical protein